MSSEDRQLARRNRRGRVTGTARILTPAGVIAGQLLDLSLGGALVRVPEWAVDLANQPEGTLELGLANQVHALRVRMYVRGPDTVAVVFHDLPAELYEILATHVLAGLDADDHDDRVADAGDVLAQHDAAHIYASPTPGAPGDYLAELAAPVAAPAPPRPARPSVLVVDDDDDLRDMLVGVLRAAGYGAEGAGDGRHALEMLRADPGRYSVILLDYRMPNLDGHQFRRAQQCDPSIAGIPVILTSGAPEAELAAIDPDAELRKPVSAPALLAAVETYRLN